MKRGEIQLMPKGRIWGHRSDLDRFGAGLRRIEKGRLTEWKDLVLVAVVLGAIACCIGCWLGYPIHGGNRATGIEESQMELKDLLTNPEVLGDLTPEDESFVLALAQRCSVQGKFHLVYDSESFYDSPNYPELQALAFALHASGTEFMEGKGTGEYYTGFAGKGWFSFGIGCPLASAICGTFVDESYYLEG